MLIESFNKSGAETQNVGLGDIKMGRLGRLVAIAGKNGSGKSRLLNMLRNSVAHRNNNIPKANDLRANIERNQILFLSGDDKSNNFLSKERAELAYLEGGLVCYEERKRFRTFKFVPKRLDLADPYAGARNTLGGQYTNAKNIEEIEQLNSYCLPYIAYLQNRWYIATHQNYPGSAEDAKRASEEYSSLLGIIEKMLGVSLSINSDGEALIFDKPLAHANLSDGQKVILQFAVALHAHDGSLSNTLFLLDEPENHLHPSAVVDVVKAIYGASDDAQIWVATHSVPLLAYMASVEPTCMWYMDGGVISHAGKDPEKVLDSLLGGEDGIAQLSTFTGLPAIMSSVRYATESLLPPQVYSQGDGDPQVRQIMGQLTQLQGAKALSILDYGAGKGRLLDGLASLLREQNRVPTGTVDYYAFDPFTDSAEECRRVIADYYADGNRLFHTPDDFFAFKDDGSIAVVVMTNVLHEIDPHDWPGIFRNNSFISRCLSDSGYLLIVEDQRIPVGEKAHKFGFLVLDTPHLKTMFGAKQRDMEEGSFIVSDARGDGRLKAHLISKRLLSNVTDESVKLAIQQFAGSARDTIKTLRERPFSAKNGQLHGFWTQQFANACLYLNNPLGS